MAITGMHFQYLFSLRASAIPNRCSLMDIGEQNWAETHSLENAVQTARAMGLVVDPAVEHELLGAETADSFVKARLFYSRLLGVAEYEAIDLHGTKRAQRIDLNRPYDPARQFDLVLNFGTTEHIFNQYEAFHSIHKLAKAGGLMIHGLPHSGDREHGFYNYHATFFFDLAAANGYEVVSFWWRGQKSKGDGTVNIIREFDKRADYLDFVAERPLGQETFLVCFRKRADAAFTCPMQGYYDKRVVGDERAKLNQFWKDHR
jgi:SAM-dependent methyltransferase